VAGATCLLRGQALFIGSPGLWPLGLLPALLALVLLVAGLVGLALALPATAAALTPFASGWAEADRGLVRTLVELVLAVAALWLALVSYTALALAIGQPFYEAIVRRVEAREGAAPAPAEPATALWAAVGRALRDGLLVVLVTAASSAALFLLGFVPLVGQTLVPVIGVCVTGFFLAVELSSIALERRGLRLSERMRLLWRHRLLAVGFGAATFLLFLVPLGAVLGMPGAVAGGTLLARRLVN
jgi:uncharacterized protein involved in cysteine biosynthesis